MWTSIVDAVTNCRSIPHIQLIRTKCAKFASPPRPSSPCSVGREWASYLEWLGQGFRSELRLRRSRATSSKSLTAGRARRPPIPSGSSGSQTSADSNCTSLNVADNPTILTFCVANKPEPKECRHKGVNPIRRLAKPKQAVIVDVKEFSKKYLIAESSEPGRAIIQVFNDDPGHRKFYSAESTISFDTPENEAPVP